MSVILGIDPGLSGGLSIIDGHDGSIMLKTVMPTVTLKTAKKTAK